MTNSPNWMVTGTVQSEYLQACADADLATFKTDKRLTTIFEHASIRQGFEYMRLIKMQTPKLIRYPFTNDKLGGPVLHHFGEVNRSPSTMQYIGVLSNLLVQMGSLDGLRIVEIGGGYGGQARTILDYCKPECYHIIDLPEVSELQKRYLHGTIAECYTSPVIGADYDLCISNYALSEVVDNAAYIKDVCCRSAHGYITCNTEYVQLPFSHTKKPDIGSERESNFILIW